MNLSRGDVGALDKAAEALFWDRVASPWADTLPYERELYLREAQLTVSAYLDALLSELPEEAVEAAVSARFYGPPYEPRTEAAIRAFLLSLRSSSRGPNG